jgi:histidine triad (HIT) family protein
MDNCIFCKIIKGEIPAEKIYEDENFLAFLDITPVNHGHTLLIPKNHYENIYVLPEDILSKISPFFKKIAMAVKKATNADGINIGMNNEGAAGQVIPHAHFHIMPRFLNDGYILWHGKEATPEELKENAEKIRQTLKQ